MTDAVVDGNSHFYLVLEGSDAIYDASITNVMDVVRYQIGDEITLEYEEGEKSNSVVKIGGARVASGGGSSGNAVDTALPSPRGVRIASAKGYKSV